MVPFRLIAILATIIAALPSVAGVAATPPPPFVILSGTPSTIDNPWCTDVVCRDFDVYGDARNTRVMLTTTGLGAARLRSGPCSTKAKSVAASALELTVNASGSRVCLCIPNDAFPDSGTVSGKILASAPPTSVETTILLVTSPWLKQNFIAALLWGLGIAIPLLLSTWVGQRVYVWQKRKDDERAAVGRQREQRRRDPDAENRLFDIFLPTLAGASDEEFANEINGQRASIDQGLTDDQSAAFNAAIETNDRAAIIEILRKAFPGHDDVLNELKRKD